MLGVEFVDPDGAVPIGARISVLAKLVYTPDVSYSALQPGTGVEALEGSRVVGHGRVVVLSSQPHNSFKPNRCGPA